MVESITRRRFLALGGNALVGGVVIACGGGQDKKGGPISETSSTRTEVPTATATPKPEYPPFVYKEPQVMLQETQQVYKKNAAQIPPVLPDGSPGTEEYYNRFMRFCLDPNQPILDRTNPCHAAIKHLIEVFRATKNPDFYDQALNWTLFILNHGQSFFNYPSQKPGDKNFWDTALFKPRYLELQQLNPRK